MTDNFSYDVFLSHSAKDKDIVCAVAERLRADGLRVWFDEWVLKPGDSIPKKIDDGLEQSRVLVLCMSAQAFGSDWAQLESYTFRFRDPLNQERRFIPLRLDNAPVKGALAQFLYFNWLPEAREQEYAKLLEACRPPTKPPMAEVKTNHKNVPAPAAIAETDVELKREQLHALLTRHLDYARDIVEARYCGDRKFLEWSRDLRQDAMSVLNSLGWDIFQRQLDADGSKGKWESSDIPNIGRVKIKVIDNEEGGQTIYRIPISPDYDRFKLVIESLPPLICQIPSEGFKRQSRA